jgi:8-oxo-dGTP diphosphatase
VHLKYHQQQHIKSELIPCSVKGAAMTLPLLPVHGKNKYKSHNKNINNKMLCIPNRFHISVICNIVLLCFIALLLLQQQRQQSLLFTSSDTMIPVGTTPTMMKQLNNRTSISTLYGTANRMVQRDYTFHGGHPTENELRGTCYCSKVDTYCMCNPSLAIDIVIVSGEDHLWFVKRKDTNQYAIVGGFVDIGETVIHAVQRELYEETGLDINSNHTITGPVLFGVYSDPRRDNRRHTVSIAFALHLDGTEQLTANDDVKNVERIFISDVHRYTLFADQKTIVQDYIRLYYDTKKKTSHDFITSYNDFAPDIHRSICIPFNVAQ